MVAFLKTKNKTTKKHTFSVRRPIGIAVNTQQQITLLFLYLSYVFIIREEKNTKQIKREKASEGPIGKSAFSMPVDIHALVLKYNSSFALLCLRSRNRRENRKNTNMLLKFTEGFFLSQKVTDNTEDCRV
mmetsp:Transcript_32614/g.49145  ORF Transcript_32614/g.49145 Transcript_32614/m.49145 type:complete len:130 (+) Transcript_32614:915-1304(+)